LIRAGKKLGWGNRRARDLELRGGGGKKKSAFAQITKKREWAGSPEKNVAGSTSNLGKKEYRKEKRGFEGVTSQSPKGEKKPRFNHTTRSN